MATYRPIATTETDPEAPLTSQLLKALEANPIAIAEGAVGAPRIVGHALQTWVSRVTLDATTTPVVVTGLNSDTVIHAVGFFSNGSGDTAQLQVSGSIDGGTSWGSWLTLTAGGASTTYSISAIINLKNGVIDSLYATVDLGTGPFNAIRFRHSNTVSSGVGAKLSLYSVGLAP
jgi:hypothetical protein